MLTESVWGSIELQALHECKASLMSHAHLSCRDFSKALCDCVDA